MSGSMFIQGKKQTKILFSAINVLRITWALWFMQWNVDTGVSGSVCQCQIWSADYSNRSCLTWEWTWYEPCLGCSVSQISQTGRGGGGVLRYCRLQTVSLPVSWWEVTHWSQLSLPGRRAAGRWCNAVHWLLNSARSDLIRLPRRRSQNKSASWSTFIIILICMVIHRTVYSYNSTCILGVWIVPFWSD